MKKRLLLIFINSLFFICLFAQSNIAVSEQYFDKARNKSFKGDERGAILDYTKAIEFNPKNSRAFAQRGFLKRGLGDYRGAILDFTKCIELIKVDTAFTIYILSNCAFAKEDLKDYQGAILDYTKCIELTGIVKSDYLFSLRGTAKSKLKDYQGAILDYNKCIELNHKYADAYYGRGFAKYYLNDKNGACLDWSQAGEFGYADAYSTIKEKCN
jgi:tetratricopeptide (TPR) repeat protein